MSLSNAAPLEGKTALITGCNRGIGRTVLELFARSGLEHAITLTRGVGSGFEADCAALAAKYGLRVTHLTADLSDEGAVKRAMRELYALKVPVDILVNNAGVAHGALLQMTSMRELKDVFEINFFSQILIIQSVAKLMVRQGEGSIVCMSSIAGFDSYPGYTAYGSSKAALAYAVKTIAQEIAPHGVRINAIAPALTDTDMARQMESKASERMIGASALKRLARQEEIANVALFLASDQSSFVCGQTIRVDGGI